tara:strand:- start:678 stop:935 length:258 start_codon:yes stop_codon:yes gene_type:complete
MKKKKFGDLSFYLSILSLLILTDPGGSLLLSILSIVFGIISLTKKVNWKAVTGLILGLISATAVTLYWVGNFERWFWSYILRIDL